MTGGFNSRTRKGCDVKGNLVSYTLAVSIHAPVKGATHQINNVQHSFRRFNSRTRKGCDMRFFTDYNGFLSFNSRTRKGCDLLVIFPPSEKSGFNSRTRKGCDRAYSNKLRQKLVSIHAPVKGATWSAKKLELANGFNSRTRKGCDLERRGNLCFTDVSIHAPVKGATSRSNTPGCLRKFQFTHP